MVHLINLRWANADFVIFIFGWREIGQKNRHIQAWRSTYLFHVDTAHVFYSFQGLRKNTPNVLRQPLSCSFDSNTYKYVFSLKLYSLITVNPIQFRFLKVRHSFRLVASWCRSLTALSFTSSNIHTLTSSKAVSYWLYWLNLHLIIPWSALSN